MDQPLASTPNCKAGRSEMAALRRSWACCFERPNFLLLGVASAGGLVSLRAKTGGTLGKYLACVVSRS